MIPIAHYLFAIAFSEYYKKADWQRWADDRILRQDKPELWLINVSLAGNIDDLSKALSDLMITERSCIKNVPPFSNAVIGYYYLQYSNKEMTVYELLQRSGEEADGGEGASRACEDFYTILTELEFNENLVLDPVFEKKIIELYDPFKQVALIQKEVLDNY